MSGRIRAVRVSALEPRRLAEFWADLLGWDGEGLELRPTDDTGFRLRFVSTRQPKIGKNQAHVDLTSTSPADQQDTVARALDLGAEHIDIGQLPTESHVVLADPEGNEFCVIEPGNAFLADCGFVGAIACDGSQDVGYFWAEALGWPLVWDRDQETAIRSPHGGPKITWGGPPLPPRIEPNRWALDISAGADELERLVSLGAGVVAPAAGSGDAATMTDPDGNLFYVSAPGLSSVDERGVDELA